MRASSPPAAPRPLGGTTALTAILTAGTAAGTFAAPVVSVLASSLIADFGISRSHLGWLPTIYAGVGAALSPLAGHLADVLGGRAVLAGTFLAGGLGTLAIGLSPSPGWLLAFAVLPGLGWASANPSTNKLVASLVPRGRRGLVMGVKQSGVQAGFFLGGALLPLGAAVLGWRPTVALAGGVCAVGALVALRGLPAGEGDRPAGRPRRSASASRPVRWLTAYAFLMGAGLAAVSTYLPLYAQEALGFGHAEAGGAAALAGLVAIAARIEWSRRSERSRHVSTPLSLLALASVAAVATIWGASAAGGWLLWPGALAAGGAAFAWNSVVMLAVVMAADERHAGAASGRVHLGFLSGLAFTPVLFGLSVDVTGSYAPGWAAVMGLFAAGAWVALAWRRTPTASNQE